MADLVLPLLFIVILFIIKLLLLWHCLPTISKKKQAQVLDITTDASKEQVQYLIDKRLLDILLANVQTASLDDIKLDMKYIIDCVDDKQTLFNKIDDYIYKNNIINSVNVLHRECNIFPHVDEHGLTITGKIDIEEHIR